MQAMQPGGPKSLSIVIPVYNARETIQPLCRRLIDLYASASELQIVLVNDCSTDDTNELCRELHAEHPEIITYLRLSRNFGEHCAVMAGLHHAQGDTVVIMDDDFQNPPEEVGKLIDALDATHDVVYARYETKEDSWWRNLGSRLNDWMAAKALGKPKGLYLSSFKAMNRFVASELIKFKGPEPYLDALILRTTNAITTALVRHDPRRRGRSGYTLRKLFALWASVLIVFSLYPIRLIGAVGFFILLAGTYLMAEDTYHTLVQAPHHEPSDVDGLTALVVFFRGLSLVAVAILGEYVGRMLTKISSDPQFIVRERFGRGGVDPNREPRLVA